MAGRKNGGAEKSPDKEKAKEPECCAVVVLRMDGKGKTVVPLKMENGELRVGDKTLKVQCGCD